MASRQGMKPLALSKVYRLIEPGPVVLLTTAAKARGRPGEHRPNVMTMSWHMMVEFEPPLIACIVSDGDYSFRTLRSTKECVIGVPSAGLVEPVVGAGNAHGGRPAGGADDGRPVVPDKFAAFGLTPIPARRVGAPLIAECFANLECRVVNTRLVGLYGLFVLEVVQAWIDRDCSVERHPKMLHHRGRGEFVADGRVIRTQSKMR